MKPVSYSQLSLYLSNLNKSWGEIPKHFESRSFLRGTIIQQNPHYLFLLESGTIRVTSSTSVGIEWILFFQKQGCIFNELMFLDSKSIISYHCHTDIKVKVIPVSFIKSNEFIQEYPNLMIDLLKTLALKEAICYSYVSDLAFSSARGRVCQALLALSRGHENEQTFVPELTQTEIAAMMGLHQTSVARVIKQLRQEGILGAYTKKRIQILDYEKLNNFDIEQNPAIL